MDGRWVKARLREKTKVTEWGDWHATKHDDWACHKCDKFVSNETDTYLGNYASDKVCRECKTPKAKCQHMKMAHRTWLKQQGKMKTFSEALEQRAKRKEEKEGWSSGAKNYYDYQHANGYNWPQNHPGNLSNNETKDKAQTEKEWLDDLIQKLQIGEIDNTEFFARREAGQQQGNVAHGSEGRVDSGDAINTGNDQPPQQEKMPLHEIEKQLKIKKQLVSDLEKSKFASMAGRGQKYGQAARRAMAERASHR